MESHAFLEGFSMLRFIARQECEGSEGVVGRASPRSVFALVLDQIIEKFAADLPLFSQSAGYFAPKDA